uniref:Uncharacterized protein n=1 Tax=Chelonoidis abingdonii TaxID=106734 RepID=A0A8C0GS28_CHEAB
SCLFPFLYLAVSVPGLRCLISARTYAARPERSCEPDLATVTLPGKGNLCKPLEWRHMGMTVDAASGKTVPLAVVTPGGPGALPRLIVEDERYRGRVRLYGRTYSLEISNLTMADEGKYEVEEILIGHHQYSCDYPLSIYSECLSVCMEGGAGAILSTEESLLVQHRLGDEDSSITCMATNPRWSSWHLVRISVSRWCPALPETPALSYCRAKGILVLGVLGTLLAGILTVHERRFHWGC